MKVLKYFFVIVICCLDNNFINCQDTTATTGATTIAGSTTSSATTSSGTTSSGTTSSGTATTTGTTTSSASTTASANKNQTTTATATTAGACVLALNGDKLHRCNLGKKCYIYITSVQKAKHDNNKKCTPKLTYAQNCDIDKECKQNKKTDCYQAP